MASANTGNFVELLAALLNSDNNQRQQAEKLYQQAKAAEPDSLIVGLLSAASAPGVDEACRSQGLVLLRQLVTAGPDKDYAFARMTPGNKSEVAAELLRRFETEANPKLQQKIGEVIAQLAEGVFDPADERAWLSPGQKGWPTLLQLIFRIADPQANAAASSCESAIRLLKNLVETLKDEIIVAQQQIGNILKNALSHSDVKVRCAAFLLVCEMVTELETQIWAPLTTTAPVLLQLLQHMAEAQLNAELDECLQALVCVVEAEPEFFKQQLAQTMEPAKFLSVLVKTREVDDGIRKISLEWLASFAVKKPKWLVKHLPAFAPLVIECCIALMLEVDDSESDLKDWMERMDDEEGEEDADEMNQVGGEVLDRLVENVGLENVSTALFAAVATCFQQENWQAKLAGLTAIRQTIEYVEDHQQVGEMGRMILQLADHPHPRVRYAAFHALGQMGNDQSPHFQESSHQTVMPALFSKFDDPVDRVASMAMSAFVTYGGELENPLMSTYSHSFMQKFVERLQGTKHRMVQEECVTSIAVIAGVLEEDFSQYYDGIMPLLKQFVLQATGEKEQRLRGKAFECMSLLGAAVGKEKFLPDAKDAVGEMLKTPAEADDEQREYINEASARICKCLQRDFAPFLPYLLPNILKSLQLEQGGNLSNGNEDDDDDDEDDDDEDEDDDEDTKIVKVHSDKFEEISNALELVHTFCQEVDAAFFDCVPRVAEAMLPLLTATDDSAMSDDLRGQAVATWAMLIKCAQSGAKERGVDNSLASNLLQTSLKCTCAQMEEEVDSEAIGAASLGLAECLKNMGPGVLSGSEVLQLVRTMFKFITESLERAEKDHNAPQDEDDEEDRENAEDEEELCRRNLEGVIGAIMEVAPSEFLQCLPECRQYIGQWLTNKQNIPLALFLACDLVRHLREQSQPIWPLFMPAVFQSLSGPDPDARIPAAWLINLAAPFDAFKEAAPEAFRRLGQIASSAPAPKKKTKKNEQADVALDNAVAALLTLAKHQGSCCPPEVPAWQLIVKKLPLRKDEDEAKKVHEAVVDLVLEQHSGILGPDNVNLGSVLSSLAEVHRSEDLSSKATDGKIQRAFQLLPQGVLAKIGSNFSGKQQKKIEKMLTKVKQHGG